MQPISSSIMYMITKINQNLLRHILMPKIKYNIKKKKIIINRGWYLIWNIYMVVNKSFKSDPDTFHILVENENYKKK